MATVKPPTHSMRYALQYLPGEWEMTPAFVRNSVARGLAARGLAEIRTASGASWLELQWRKPRTPKGTE